MSISRSILLKIKSKQLSYSFWTTTKSKFTLFQEARVQLLDVAMEWELVNSEPHLCLHWDMKHRLLFWSQQECLPETQNLGMIVAVHLSAIKYNEKV